MTHPDANTVDFVMLSSGFENGGNVTHRFFDGHPECFVYPFESQLGTRSTSDFLSSIERFQYRYPEFPMHGTPEEDYEAFFDEELKTLLRTGRSKFRDAGVEMDETERRRRFVEIQSSRPRTRGNIVAAFFQATFDAWTNYQRSGRNHVYVGYSPAIGMDGDRILADFPRGHVVHIVRNPFSAYADTKKRPFPLPMRRYIVTWNLYHHLALMNHHRYPDRFHLLRYEDLVADPRAALTPICAKIGIEFADTMTYPSFNGRNISDRIYPWGTILQATPSANVATMNELPQDEFDEIRAISTEMLRVFRYEDLLAQRA